MVISHPKLKDNHCNQIPWCKNCQFTLIQHFDQVIEMWPSWSDKNIPSGNQTRKVLQYIDRNHLNPPKMGNPPVIGTI